MSWACYLWGHPLVTVQAGPEGSSKADQSPYQLPSSRVMQVRHVPGMARQWGYWADLIQRATTVLFPPPRLCAFLCLLEDWASVDGVTSFLCTLLSSMCLNAWLLWGTLRFGPSSWWTKFLWESWGRSRVSLDTDFCPIWTVELTAGGLKPWKNFSRGGHAGSTKQAWLGGDEVMKSLGSHVPPCHSCRRGAREGPVAKFEAEDRSRASQDGSVLRESFGEEQRTEQKNREPVMSVLEAGSWLAVRIAFGDNHWAGQEQTVAAGCVCILSPYRLPTATACEFADKLFISTPMDWGLGAWDPSDSWSRVGVKQLLLWCKQLQLTRFLWLCSTGVGVQDSHQWGLFQPQLITELWWGLPSTWCWSLTPRECLGSRLRWQRPSLWKVQGLHF